jgi:predicted glycoside hydrolase/deacetylase ChbG (UPF0249 family)
LIVNADDFGFTIDVNAGIVEAHRKGVVTATTLMANGGAFDDAIRLARETPSLDIGCHFVLVQGCSLASGDPLPEKFTELMQALITRRINPYFELRRQVEKLLASGIHPTHFDTHKHTHVLPPVFSAVVRLAREFEVPFIRLPFDAGWLPVRGMDRWYRGRLRRTRIRATDHFEGFRLTDSFSEETFTKALKSLRPGLTEFMCHPGYLGPELRKAATRLKESRQRELKALTSPAVKRLLGELGVRLTTYRELRDA